MVVIKSTVAVVFRSEVVEVLLDNKVDCLLDNEVDFLLDNEVDSVLDNKVDSVLNDGILLDNKIVGRVIRVGWKHLNGLLQPQFEGHIWKQLKSGFSSE